MRSAHSLLHKSPHDLTLYLNRVNVNGGIAGSYISTLDALNIPDERILKEESSIRLVVAIAKGSTQLARILHELCPDLISDDFGIREDEFLTAEDSLDEAILKSLRAIIIASEASR
jgi:hypothetical protein